MFKLIIFTSLVILSTICCESANGETHESIHQKGSVFYSPFKPPHIGEHKFPMLIFIYIIIFSLIKLLAMVNISYCRLVKCNGKQNVNEELVGGDASLKKCQHHLTKLGNILPESAFMLITGTICGLIFINIPWLKAEDSLSPKLVFNWMLIPIVLQAGWSVNKNLFRNIGTILWFAIVGTITNAIILTPFLYYCSKSRWGIFQHIDFDIIDSPLFSMIISAVDPVAVLSVFEELRVEKVLYNVVLGESLLNDGVVVAIYKSLTGMKGMYIEYGANLDLAVSLCYIFGGFVVTLLVSIAFAFVFSFIVNMVTKVTYKHQSASVTMFVFFNCLAYTCSEVFYGSGIVTLYFAVIMQKQYVTSNFTETSQITVTNGLACLSHISEGVLFVQMGIRAWSSNGILNYTDVTFSFFLILLCFVSRFITIFSLGGIANLLRVDKLGFKTLFIQAYGGLRGAIGYSLSLLLDEKFENRHYYQNSTAIMVYFSVFILGSTIKPLVRCLKIPTEENKPKPILLTDMMSNFMEETKNGYKDILASTSWRHRFERWFTKINNRYLKKLFIHEDAPERHLMHSKIAINYKLQVMLDAHNTGERLIKDAVGTENRVNTISENIQLNQLQHRIEKSHIDLQNIINMEQLQQKEIALLKNAEDEFLEQTENKQQATTVKFANDSDNKENSTNQSTSNKSENVTKIYLY